MALLAETLVDEWLNRQGFFTVRGVKQGVHEIDLLGVKPVENGLEARHIEVQVSFRPIGYICPLAKEYIPSFSKNKTSAKARSKQMIRPCVEAWIEKKFTSNAKSRMREATWPARTWKYAVVHGVVREPAELEVMRSAGIETIALHEILADLRHIEGKFTGGAGTDIAELIEYYNHAANGG